MEWREFIFSEKRNHKVTRHVTFWTAWFLYFLACYFLLQQPVPQSRMKPGHVFFGSPLLVKTLLFLILYATACYVLIYQSIPRLINRKWLMAIVSLIFIFSYLLISSHLLYWKLFPTIESYFGTAVQARNAAWFWPAVNLGLMNFFKVATAAAIIRYIKYWWLKEKESQRLEKEKISAELKLLKAQVHPDFLFKTLNNIHSHALSSSARTSGMLLKLSDMLSYMLYDCEGSTVPLDKEIQMMKEYMHLEKIRHNDEPEIQVNTRGGLANKSIAPFLLLPFIENSFSYFNKMTDHFWINLDIRLEGNQFSMKLANGISTIPEDQTLVITKGLADVQKRLSLLYPSNYELKMSAEQEMFIVFLDIRLSDESELPPQKAKDRIDPVLV